MPEDLRGLDRFEARKLVVHQITSEGLAVMLPETVTDDDGNEETQLVPYIESKPIMQPFGDRSQVVIEPMLTDQWFVDAEKVVTPALEAVRSGKTKIIPESGEKTYYHWLENHRTLVHLAPTLVGPPNSRLVRPRSLRQRLCRR